MASPEIERTPAIFSGKLWPEKFMVVSPNSSKIQPEMASCSLSLRAGGVMVHSGDLAAMPPSGSSALNVAHFHSGLNT